ncbi:MAG: hypothetical protein KIT31_38520 [Deltaproteobacteria bacterium]|nr:hypothetical protein [Deltaproteobacteria bacterium]
MMAIDPTLDRGALALLQPMAIDPMLDRGTLARTRPVGAVMTNDPTLDRGAATGLTSDRGSHPPQVGR